jgi:putative glycosyltransferase (TIGR04372 family)
VKRLLLHVPGVRGAYDVAVATARVATRRVVSVVINVVLWLAEAAGTSVKVCVLPGMDRLGQQATFVDAYLRRWALEKSSAKVVFVYSGSANSELNRILRRYAKLITHPVLARLIEIAAPSIADRFQSPHIFANYGAREFATTGAVLALDEADRTRGRAALEKIGLGPSDWFITFHARDQAYLNLRYHDYRNGSIDNCLAAAREVVARGGWALRLGAAVEHPLPPGTGPNIVDYAAKYRTEFLDIYLTAENVFHIGNSSGISAVPIVFGKPCGMANMVPLGCFGIGARTLWMPKLVREKKTGQILSFAEAYELKLFSVDGALFLSQTYESMGFEFVENTAEDILGLCRDLFDLIEGNPATSQAEELQQTYRERYLAKLPDFQYSSPIAPSFALRHRHLIEC